MAEQALCRQSQPGQGKVENRRTDVPLEAPQHFEQRRYPRAKGSAGPACRDVNYPDEANEDVGDLHFILVAPPFLKGMDPLR